MKQLLFLLLFISVFTSCSIERRRYLPGYHIEGRWTKDEGRSAVCELRSMSGEGDRLTLNQCADKVELTVESVEVVPVFLAKKKSSLLQSSNPVCAPHSAVSVPSDPAHRPSSFVLRPSPFDSDTLKKPYKPQQQYREVDPVGKTSVILVVVAVALQKVAALLTWFEVVMPLSFGPGIFIPALVLAIIGLGLSAYSAYRVRKYPEKYKKNEWGKAALSILGWQILMSVLFAWLLGGLPVG
jgi:hypothetical protein